MKTVAKPVSAGGRRWTAEAGAVDLEVVAHLDDAAGENAGRDARCSPSKAAQPEGADTVNAAGPARIRRHIENDLRFGRREREGDAAQQR